MANVVFLAGLVVVLAGLTSFAAWARRTGRGSGVAGALAAYEDAYRGTAHRSYHELRLQAGRKSETGSPEDL
ncbi:hypothetical protein [Kribbella sp. NPDC004536]|uniref:hypothetical protein n=1 Tax=Kribbella sp. NPDC004536 TaxID=3364106 RepID=UPI003674D7F4